MSFVDVRDEICPRPALIVRQELTELERGETLVVRGDYPPAERNLQRMCKKHGYEISKGEAPDGEFELHVHVTADTTLSEG